MFKYIKSFLTNYVHYRHNFDKNELAKQAKNTMNCGNIEEWYNMQVNVKQFLEEAGITEAFYPGKRLVHSCRQPGEYKSHCVVLDWRNPDKIKIEVKAGLSGKDLDLCCH